MYQNRISYNITASGAADAATPAVTRTSLRNGLLDTPAAASGGLQASDAGEKIVTPKNHLIFATWNVQSGYQVGKIEQICSETSRYNIDLTALTELRLTGSGVKQVSNLDNTVNMQLYFSGGESHVRGVGFLLNERCKQSVTAFVPISDRIATITLNGTTPLTIVAVYAPTEVSPDDEKDRFYIDLQNILNEIPKRGPILVVGDLNAQMGTSRTGWEEVMGKFSCGNLNDNGLRLVSFASYNSLIIANTYFRHKPIHKMTWSSRALKAASMIDYFLINHRFKSTIQDVRVMRGAEVGSDHHLVRCKLKLRLKAVPRYRQPPRLDHAQLMRSPYKEQFQIQLCNRFDVLQCSKDIDEQWVDLQTAVMETTTAVCPKVEKKRRQKWVSDDTIELIQQRNTAKLTDPTRAKKMTKKIQRRLKSEKEHFWDTFAVEMEVAAGRGDQRMLFSTLKMLTGKRSQPFMNIRDAVGRVAQSTDEALEFWKQHFDMLLNCEPPTSLDQDLDVESAPGNVNIDEPTKAEVTAAIKRLKNGKAPGPDMITAEAMKAGGDPLTDKLHKLITSIWNAERVPAEWKLADIIPVYKKGDKTRCENYRGISLLSVAGKVLAQIIRARLQPFRESTTREQQCGFRPGRGCIDQIFSVRQVLEERIRCDKKTVAIFIDFKNAFDSVHRVSMWKALKAIGVPPKLVNVIAAYYDITPCQVKVHGERSRSFLIRTGVRQGCVLSPLLFNIIIDWIMEKSLAGRPGVVCGADDLTFTDAAYADDIVFLEESEASAQELLNIISEKAGKLGLRINAKKTKCMTTDGSQITLAVAGEPIEQVDDFKYLGSLISASKIAATADVVARIGSAQSAFASLRWCLWKKRNVSLKTKMRVFNAAIIPILLYASETWTLLAGDLRALETFHMRCLRTILGITLLHRWRNETIRQRCHQQKTVEQIIRRSRLRWFGHVARMDPSRMPNRLLQRRRPSNWKVQRAAPKKTWASQIEAEAKRIRLTTGDLITAAQNRPQWRAFCEDSSVLAATAPARLPYNLRRCTAGARAND